MAYVYHLVSDDFRGDLLLPHNALRDAYPDIYELERVKYQNRESVLQFKVPHINVAWGDTVNLAALDPTHLAAARRRLNILYSRLLERRIVKIPAERLVGRNVVIYNSATHWINSSPGEDVPLTPPESEFEPFDISTYEELSEVPKLHLDYLIQKRDRGEPPLGFVFVRHVLVEGPIDISDLDRLPF